MAKLSLILLILLSACSSVKRDMRGADFQTPMIDVHDVRALFVGDSITANWRTAVDNRGTGMPGQNSEVIGRRFAAEIQAGSPRYVHILAGTNDVGVGLSQAQTFANIDSMIWAARQRSIPVIVGTLPPLDMTLFPTRAPLIGPFNEGLKAHVRPQGVFIADYYSAMILPSGLQNSTLFQDGIHPNDAGYEVMNKVLKQTKREMYATLYTPEQRKAWFEKKYTPEQREAWKAKHKN